MAMGEPNLDELRGYFLRVKAMAEEGLAKCEALAPARPSSDRLPMWMTIVEYAEHRGVSRATVYQWRKLGMPCSKRGKVVRVPVRDADGWEPEGAIERDAEVQASGGRR